MELRRFVKQHALYIEILALLVMMLVSGCKSEEPEADSWDVQYMALFDLSIDLMDQKNYDDAEKKLQDLSEMLDQIEVEAEKLVSLKGDVEYALGEISYVKCDYRAAYDYYNSAYAYYKGLNDGTDMQMDCRLQLAFLEDSYLGRSEHALAEYVDIYEHSTMPKYRDVALCSLFSLYVSMDSRLKVEQYLDLVKNIVDDLPITNIEELHVLFGGDEKALKREAALGRILDSDRFLDAYKTLGYYYRKIDEPEMSIKMLENALTLANIIDADDNANKIGIYKNLAFVYMYFNGDASNEYINKAKSIIDETYLSSYVRASAYVSISESFLMVGDYEGFKDCLNQAIEIIEDSVGSNHEIVALAKVLLSQYYRITGEYQLAIKNCEEAIEIYKDLLSENIGAAYNNLAICYSMGKDYEKGIEAYLKAIEIYKELSNDQQVAVAERNIALIYNNTFHNHELALKYANEAIDLIDSMDKAYYGGTYAAIYMVMADILEPSDEQYGMIEQYSEKAYQCLQNAVGNVDEAMGNYHYNLGNYLYDNGRYQEALEHLLSAEDLFGIVYGETSLYPVDILGDIGICYSRIGFYDDALSYFEKSIDYNTEHAAKLRTQGIYQTSYWDSQKQKSLSEIESISYVQMESPPNLFGGRFIDNESGYEIKFENLEADGKITFRINWSDSIIGSKDGNMITFDNKNGNDIRISGKIELLEDRAILTIRSSSLSDIKVGKTEYQFVSDKILNQNICKKLCQNTDERGWKLGYMPSWMKQTYLRFYHNGTLRIWKESSNENKKGYEEIIVDYQVKSEKRILIKSVEYSLSITNEWLSIWPIHSNELFIGGSYDLMKEDDGIYGALD